MNALEKLAIRIRHLPFLKKADVLWNGIRPLYNKLVALSAAGGLKRVINGTDVLLLPPRLREIKEVYEPEVWRVVMAALHAGARVVDAGAHWGLYAVPMARRVGAGGKIWAAEPDPGNRAVLAELIALNQVGQQVEVVPAALSDHCGQAVLHLEGIQSQLRDTADTANGTEVEMRTIDAVVEGSSVDLILVDVEGFELPVLRGAAQLLADVERRPKTIVIEVHPYAWHHSGTTSAELLGWLKGYGYQVSDVAGAEVTEVDFYGHIVARVG